MSSNQGSGCLSIFFKKKRVEKESFPYIVNEQFLSADEFSFYMLAHQVLHTKYTICPKVALAELLYVSNRDQSAQNRISMKRIDFVVCDSQTMKPVYAIELDDKSHESKKRKERDQFLDGVFAAAGLPLVHIRDQRGYSREELSALLLKPIINTQKPVSQMHAAVSESEKNMSANPPKCPKCGQEMVLRTATTGAHSGSKFWGCVNYPNCRGIIEIHEN